mmetsp:Transcript_180/g.553  ORF Transcript_180/g.553 Transcript_180/m.553 type:complete len:202 (+) Transcript_180:1290-1895(+)
MPRCSCSSRSVAAKRVDGLFYALWLRCRSLFCLTPSAMSSSARSIVALSTPTRVHDCRDAKSDGVIDASRDSDSVTVGVCTSMVPGPVCRTSTPGRVRSTRSASRSRSRGSADAKKSSLPRRTRQYRGLPFISSAHPVLILVPYSWMCVALGNSCENALSISLKTNSALSREVWRWSMAESAGSLVCTRKFIRGARGWGTE